jgi:predicted O-methyltransferase YrrM
MTATRTAKDLAGVKGWYGEIDIRCFSALLDSQVDSAPGTLVELGAFMGKSAIVIGDYLREGERFVVVDLFGDKTRFTDSAEDEANRRELRRSYPRLDRQRFEENYLAFHDELPDVVQGFTAEVVDHVAPGTARFIHVDASHLYPAVKTDCESTKLLLRPGGVVAFDDYCNFKCPGVAAAIWQSVAVDGLIPIATTRKKLYACYDDPTPHQEVLRAMIAEDPASYDVDEPEVMGRRVLRIQFAPKPPRDDAPEQAHDVPRRGSRLRRR